MDRFQVSAFGRENLIECESLLKHNLMLLLLRYHSLFKFTHVLVLKLFLLSLEWALILLHFLDKGKQRVVARLLIIVQFPEVTCAVRVAVPLILLLHLVLEFLLIELFHFGVLDVLLVLLVLLVVASVAIDEDVVALLLGVLVTVPSTHFLQAMTILIPLMLRLAQQLTIWYLLRLLWAAITIGANCSTLQTVLLLASPDCRRVHCLICWTLMACLVVVVHVAYSIIDLF